MSSLPTMDFDGEILSYIKSYGEIASEPVHRIRKAKSLDEQCKLLLELTDVSRTQLRNMSRRRNQRWIVRIKPVMKRVEQTGTAFNNFLGAWLESL